jgi:branched-chain amino acid transport system permease protein
MTILESRSLAEPSAPTSTRTGFLRSLFREPGGAQLAIGLAAVVAAVAIPEALGLVYLTGVMQLAVVYVVASVFMSILLVDAGRVSFGHGAVFGAAAYAVGIACGIHGEPFIVGVMFGILASLAVGALFALPALRVQALRP